MTKYSKAIAAGLATIIATVVAIWQGADPSTIQGNTAALTGVGATLLVIFGPKNTD